MAVDLGRGGRIDLESLDWDNRETSQPGLLAGLLVVDQGESVQFVGGTHR